MYLYCGFDYFLFNLVSTSGGELCKSACLLRVWLFSLQSCLLFRRWVTWKCMFIVFDFFHFNLVSTSVGELFKSACLLCVWLFSFQSCLHFSRWVTWKCMFIVYLTIFPSFLTPLQSVSYVNVHVYCGFDYFLFNLVSTSGGELRKSACLCVFDYFLFNLVSTSVGELRGSACLLCVWLFSPQSCLLFRRWVTWKCMFIMLLQSCLHFRSVSYVKVNVCLTIFSSILSLLACELRECACLLCFSLHFSRWVTWKCMFIVCLTIFSLCLYFSELCKSACLLRVWLFSLQHFSRWVTWKCMFIVCLTIFSSILSPLQSGELHESACLLCVWLFSLQSCLHFSRWVTWSACLLCVWLFLFNLVSTLDCELRKSVSLLWVWLFSFQSCLYFRRWVM